MRGCDLSNRSAHVNLIPGILEEFGENPGGQGLLL